MALPLKVVLGALYLGVSLELLHRYPTPATALAENRPWIATYGLINLIAMAILCVRLLSLLGYFRVSSSLLSFMTGAMSMVLYTHGAIRQWLVERREPFVLPHHAYLTVQCREFCMFTCALLLTSHMIPTGKLSIFVTLLSGLMYYLCYCAMQWDPQEGTRSIIEGQALFVTAEQLSESVFIPVGSRVAYGACLVSTFLQVYGTYVQKDSTRLVSVGRFINSVLGLGVLYYLRLLLFSWKKSRWYTILPVELGKWILRANVWLTFLPFNELRLAFAWVTLGLFASAFTTSTSTRTRLPGQFPSPHVYAASVAYAAINVYCETRILNDKTELRPFTYQSFLLKFNLVSYLMLQGLLVQGKPP